MHGIDVQPTASRLPMSWPIDGCGQNASAGSTLRTNELQGPHCIEVAAACLRLACATCTAPLRRNPAISGGITAPEVQRKCDSSSQSCWDFLTRGVAPATGGPVSRDTSTSLLFFSRAESCLAIGEPASQRAACASMNSSSSDTQAFGAITYASAPLPCIHTYAPRAS